MRHQDDIFEETQHFLKLSQWERQFAVFAGFSTRNGGMSSGSFSSMNVSYDVGDVPETVLANREQIAQETAIPYETWVFAEQRHTNHIQEVTHADRGRGTRFAADAIPNTDGMYTKEKNLVLATLHADCTPIYFCAPKQGLIGLVHAGWKGTAQGIVKQFIEHWKKLDVAPEEMFLAFGPSASQKKYEVDDVVRNKILDMRVPYVQDAFIERRNGKYLLDTAYVNVLAARALRVPQANIIRTRYCTIKDEARFFSYRRDHQTGRMLAFIRQ